MVDILAIGSGAVNAYRQALSTTSNNIANVNTPGYSRRELKMGESFPVQEGIFSFGTGAQAQAVARAYDEFVERSLRDATSDLKVNDAVIEYANRIIDLTASEDASLSNAMDGFFNAAQQLSTEPRSIPLRNEFLNRAEVVAVRFNDLSLQIDRIAEESTVALEQSVSELNALSEQLRKVNDELNRKDSIDKQPPGLLDQRDALLRDISALVKVGVTEWPNGQVQVNFGGAGRGFEIVTRTEAKPIAVVSAGDASVAGARLVLDPYGVKRSLPSGPSGAIGGALNLSAEVLRPIRTGLDHLAKEFASRVNAIHREGLDAEGNFGGDLFRVATSFVGSMATATGAISASAKVFNELEAPTEALELVYRAGTDTWDVHDLVTKERLAEVQHGSEGYQALGMSFSMAGEPVNGDTVVFAPKDRPSRTFELLIKDSSRVAVGASMRYMPDGNNSNDIAVTLSTIPEQERPSGFEYGYKLTNYDDKTHVKGMTVHADERRPVVQVARGTTGPEIFFNIGRDSDQHIQILTRERMHIAGTYKYDGDAPGTQLTSFDSGFGEGAYSQEHFNSSGQDAFLDTTIEFGVRAQSRTESKPSIDPDTGSLTETVLVQPASLSSNTLSAILSDGTPFVAADALTLSTVHYSAEENNGAGGNVTTDVSLGAFVVNNGERLSAAKIRDYFNEQLAGENIKNIVASAETFVSASNLDASKTLTINGNTIDFESKGAGIANLVSAINKQSELTKVHALWVGNDAIQLTNTVGSEGENIVIGTVGPDETSNALGLANGTYSGTYRLDAVGDMREEVTSRLFSSQSQILNDGSAFDLTLHLNGGAETVTVATDTPQGIVDAINNAAVGVTAVLVEDDSDTSGFRITLDDGADNDFKVESNLSFIESGYDYADQDLGFNDARNRSTNLNKPSEISLTLGDGVPADLGSMGFATGVLFDGDVPDDLAIFLTGSGSAQATFRAEQKAESGLAQYPADAFKVVFDPDAATTGQASFYEIVDIATDTVVAVRDFTIPADGEIPEIQYQGVRMRFAEAPMKGDIFTIEPNTNGVGSNDNILRIIELGKEATIAGQTFSNAYLDLVAGVGSRSQLAELSREAMEVVRDQAQASREAAVGVNLDEEAADLIRFQQAYQAAAQVIQISQRMFDTLIQAS